ncbi:hypothetical protein [Peribacillus frigoritolerans]|uniref:hypothetical protein n=1 Tax=Peribacillus frigoritolerans TaxID=450367 RepID=UPI002280F23F|nr:hypothetical protein [Peribacillus frigoritolerans]MCY9140566.1 hypothetical protein [Peribacillus frigoritolerans]
MIVELEYIKNDMIDGRLMPGKERFVEIVEIDNKPGNDLDKLVDDELGKKLNLNRDRFKILSINTIKSDKFNPGVPFSDQREAIYGDMKNAPPNYGDGEE